MGEDQILVGIYPANLCCLAQNTVVGHIPTRLASDLLEARSSVNHPCIHTFNILSIASSYSSSSAPEWFTNCTCLFCIVSMPLKIQVVGSPPLLGDFRNSKSTWSRIWVGQTYVDPFTYLACLPSWFLRYQKWCESGITESGGGSAVLASPASRLSLKPGWSIIIFPEVNQLSFKCVGRRCYFALFYFQQFQDFLKLVTWKTYLTRLEGKQNLYAIFKLRKKKVTLCFSTTDTLFPAKSSCSPVTLKHVWNISLKILSPGKLFFFFKENIEKSLLRSSGK